MIAFPNRKLGKIMGRKRKVETNPVVNGIIEKQREDAERKSIESAMEARAVKLAEGFKAPVAANPHNSAKLAEALSSQFQNLTVSVRYENGNAAVYAAPCWRPAMSRGFSIRQMSEWTDAYWPTYETVRAFANGYDAGQRASERERDRRWQMYPMYPMYPMHPMHPPIISPY